MSNPPLSAAQCRAARALLRWSIARLAEAAALGINTIGRFEQEKHQPTRANALRVRQVLEEAGVIFIDDEGPAGGPGVRLKPQLPPDVP